MRYDKRKCNKIVYEALGKVHVAYSPNKVSDKDIEKIITSICDTAVIKSIEPFEAEHEDFDLQNLSNVSEWLKSF